jgi:hypothetical protein
VVGFARDIFFRVNGCSGAEGWLACRFGFEPCSICARTVPEVLVAFLSHVVDAVPCYFAAVEVLYVLELLHQGYLFLSKCVALLLCFATRYWNSATAFSCSDLYETLCFFRQAGEKMARLRDGFGRRCFEFESFSIFVRTVTIRSPGDFLSVIADAVLWCFAPGGFESHVT